MTNITSLWGVHKVLRGTVEHQVGCPVPVQSLQRSDTAEAFIFPAPRGWRAFWSSLFEGLMETLLGQTSYCLTRTPHSHQARRARIRSLRDRRNPAGTWSLGSWWRRHSWRRHVLRIRTWNLERSRADFAQISRSHCELPSLFDQTRTNDSLNHLHLRALATR